MHIDRDDVMKITEDVWSSMLGLTVTAAPPTPPPDHGEVMSGRVAFCGAFCGFVWLHSTVTLARRVAGVMLGDDPEHLSTSDIYDSVGELTNMVAGNIKSLLPAPTQLAMPMVVTPEEVAAEEGPLLAQLTLTCEGQPLWVRITADTGARRAGAESNSKRGVM